MEPCAETKTPEYQRTLEERLQDLQGNPNTAREETEKWLTQIYGSITQNIPNLDLRQFNINDLEVGIKVRIIGLSHLPKTVAGSYMNCFVKPVGEPARKIPPKGE